MRSPLLPVAGLAVDVPVRAVAGDNRVQGLGAVVALVALPVPLAALGEHLLGGEHYAAASRTALTRRRFDRRGVDHGGARGRVAAARGRREKKTNRFGDGRTFIVDGSDDTHTHTCKHALACAREVR